MYNWKETTLEEVIYPVSETFDFTGKDVVHFLNTGDILDGKLLHNDFVKVETLPGQAKKSFLLGDILYSEIRPANKRYMLVDFGSSNSVASTKLMVLRTKDGVDKQFIYQILTSEDTLKEFQFIAESRSGTFPQITFEAISFFPILLPPLPEQRAIAAILSSFDDKIELLRRQNKTLESIAQTIFKEWFVKFKVNGKKQKINSSTCLPEEWRMGKLGDILELAYGKALKEEERTGKGYPVIGSSGIVGYHSEYLANSFGIVVGRKGSMGTVIWIEDKFFPIDTTFYVVDRLGVKDLFFHYFVLRNIDFQRIGSDSAVPGLNRTLACSLELIIPKKEAIEEFNKAIKPIFQKTKNNNSQIQTLSKLRDTLLPKLMKGKIRIKP